MPSELPPARTRRQRANAIAERLFKPPDVQPKKGMRRTLQQIPTKIRDWGLDYLSFFRASVAEFLMDIKEHKLASVLRAVLYLIIAWVIFVITDWMGVPLKDVALGVWRLLLPAWWAVVGLIGLIILLLCVIDGSRKLHRRMLREICEIYEDAKLEQQDNSDYMITVARLRGAVDALWGYLDRQEQQKTNGALPTLDIKYFEVEMRSQLNQIEKELGDKSINPDDVPQSGTTQKGRFYEYQGQLESLFRAFQGSRERISDQMHEQVRQALTMKRRHERP